MKKEQKLKKRRIAENKFSFLKSKEFTINLSFFILLLFIFMFQFPHIGDDFKVYILNGEFLINRYFKAGLPNAWYFEPQRPTLVPLILGFIEMFFNLFVHQPFVLRSIAIFIFLLINLIVFIYAINYFSKSFKINKILLFCFIISSYFLTYSFLEGTELLSLSLLMIAFARLVQQKNSGIFFALAALTRFDFLIFSPFIVASLFISENRKENIKIFFKDFISFVAIFSIYGIITFFVYGLAFLPIIDSFFFSGYLQNYLFRPLSLADFSSVAIIFYGSIISIGFSILMQKRKFFNKENIIMLIFLLIVVTRFAFTSFKIERYLFPLVLPCGYFLALFFQMLWNYSNKNIEKKKERIMKILKIILVILLSIYVIYNILDSIARIKKDTSYLEEENKMFVNTLMQISYDKPIETNYHVALIYLTQNYGIFHKIYPMLRHLNFNQTLECYNVLLFYPNKKPDWKEEYYDLDEKLKSIGNDINILKNEYVVFMQKNSNMNCSYENSFDYSLLEKLKKRIPDLSYAEMFQKSK